MRGVLRQREPGPILLAEIINHAGSWGFARIRASLSIKASGGRKPNFQRSISAHAEGLAFAAVSSNSNNSSLNSEVPAKYSSKVEIMRSTIATKAVGLSPQPGQSNLYSQLICSSLSYPGSGA